MRSPSSDQTVVYFLPEFPRTSETFVAGEVLRLHRRGLRVIPIVLSTSEVKDPHLAARLQTAGIRPLYLMDRSPARVARWALAYVIGHPVRAARGGWRSFRTPILNDASRLARWLKVLAGAELVRRCGATRVHSHWTLPGDVALAVADLEGLPFSHFAHAHDIWVDGEAYERRRPGTGLASRIARAEFMATCTRLGYEHLRSLAAPEHVHKVKLVYHGVDLDIFRPRATEPTEQAVIMTLGRLVAYKGFDRVIQACATLRREGLDFRCVIAGDGSQRPSLEALVAELDLTNYVEFTGAISQQEVRNRLAEASVFVLAARESAGQYGLPNVLFEAMASTVATVSTTLAGIDELIQHGRNGMVARDDEELVTYLRALLNDSRERRRLAAAGRVTIQENFDADKTLDPLYKMLSGQEVAERI